MAFYSRYHVVAPLPAKLRFRNGIVALECVRDCSQPIPTWVFRARRVVYGYRRPEVVALPANPLPTISPSMAVPVGPSVTLVSTAFGQRDLQRAMRERGFVLADGSREARVMDALVRLGCAEKRPATGRDIS